MLTVPKTHTVNVCLMDINVCNNQSNSVIKGKKSDMTSRLIYNVHFRNVVTIGIVLVKIDTKIVEKCHMLHKYNLGFSLLLFLLSFIYQI